MAARKAGVVSYDVDFIGRTVIYYESGGEKDERPDKGTACPAEKPRKPEEQKIASPVGLQNGCGRRSAERPCHKRHTESSGTT